MFCLYIFEIYEAYVCRKTGEEKKEASWTVLVEMGKQKVYLWETLQELTFEDEGLSIMNMLLTDFTHIETRRQPKILMWVNHMCLR